MSIIDFKITVVTATLNAERFLPRLVLSLCGQTDLDFEWIVADGCSTDNTHSIIRSINNLKVRLLIAKDFGIYDALNHAISEINDGYYLVVGADDILYPNAICDYRDVIRAHKPDIIAASVCQSGRIVPARQGLGWFYGLSGIASSHAVGMMLKVNLHQRYGLYSSKYPIAADQYFVRLALAGGATIVRQSFVAGEFSAEGTSGKDPIGLLTEVFRIQVITEKPVIFQYLLFGLRLSKLYLLQRLKGISKKVYRG